MCRIGIVGGVGPAAGVDLVNKIITNTKALVDQEHIPVYLLSEPEIEDRSRFVLGLSSKNPAFHVISVIEKLAFLGAKVVGIPCNTMHTPLIWDVILSELSNKRLELDLLDITECCAAFIHQLPGHVNRVGVLATNGTVHGRTYERAFTKYGFEAIYPAADLQTIVHNCIYQIKQSAYDKKSILSELQSAADSLLSNGAQVLVLGCTELPLVFSNNETGLPVIDATNILARALIYKASPEKLLPLP